MDLLRSSIESIFYSFPLEYVAEAIVSGEDEKLSLDRLIEIVKWKNKAFTYPELSLLGSMLESEWIVDNEFNITRDNMSFLSRLPLILNVFAREVLTCSNLDYPKVRFNNLMRWRMCTLMFGEDLFTLPYLARIDLGRRLERTDFCWQNILEHDNFRLNAILNNVLSDTHSHINAALDVSEFNWISLMNSPVRLLSLGQNDEFMGNGERREYDLVKRCSEFNLSLSEWTIVAATIRLWLYALSNGYITAITRELIYRMLVDRSELYRIAEYIENEINIHTGNSLGLNIADDGGNYPFDYALQKSDWDVPGISSIPRNPFLIHNGERKLLYKWFTHYYGGNTVFREITPYILLYLLIKTKIRREFIQTNELSGFRNFQDYQKRKSNFLSGYSKATKPYYREIAYRYAIQSSIGLEGKNNVEARMTPNAISDFRKMNYHRAIFSGASDIEVKRRNPVSFVAHFIKRWDREDAYGTLYRHTSTRRILWDDIKTVVEEFRKNDSAEYPDVTGIDAAGDELSCRPEVFAPMFRYARYCGISKFTYHAGEDFYDIVDGLRTIVEAIEFLGYSMGDRIGHGLALGTDTKDFYSQRHNILMIPRQVLLDNLVWLKYQAGQYHIMLSSDTNLFIERYFNEIGRELGYFSISSSMYEYYCGMKLRGDLISEDNVADSISIPDDVKYSPVSKQLGHKNIPDKLWKFYEEDPMCRENGLRPIMVSLPDSYGEDVGKLQEALLYRIETEGIVIETNPSSNLKIGRFDRYDKHPITFFNSVIPSPDTHSIVVSINTDDKGVFSTSLKNEYSLIAIALKKQKDVNGKRIWSEGQIEDYLRRVATYGNISRF